MIKWLVVCKIVFTSIIADLITAMREILLPLITRKISLIILVALYKKASWSKR